MSTAIAEGDVIEIDLDLIDWFKIRISLPDYTDSLWNDGATAIIAEFCSNRSLTKLICYIDGDFGLVLSVHRVPSLRRRVKKIQYFLKPAEGVELTSDNVNRACQHGMLQGNAMFSLLHLMHGLFLPSFLSNVSWPESVRKEFSGQLHKFMASLTEAAYQTRGNTVLYLPQEDVADPLVAAQDKDLVQRLEATIHHWDRQIKEVVSNQDTGQSSGNSGPLEEIDFWDMRTIDLSGIRAQLDRPGVKRIVAVLQVAESKSERFLADFLRNSTTIETGSIQAKDNLVFLSALKPSCTKLANATPAQIPALLPTILNIIRMIWSISTYYNTVDRITGLLRKVSNQIIIQCSTAIDLNEIWNGDILKSMEVIQQSIECGKAWHAVYNRTKDAIAADDTAPSWTFDASFHGIFAQIDAFQGRCLNLLEVCEGQMQFARRHLITADDDRDAIAPLPCFGGTRGEDIEKSLFEIQDAFKKHVSVLQDLPYEILNVKATTSQWLYDYGIFKTGLEEVEVMMIDVIDRHWMDVTRVEVGVQFLEGFYHLAIRRDMKKCIEQKSRMLFQMFLTESQTIQEGILQKFGAAPPLSPGHPKFAGKALWAKMLMKRLMEQYTVLEQAYWLPPCAEKDRAFHSYKQAHKKLDVYIRETHEQWKKQVSDGARDEQDLAHRLTRHKLMEWRNDDEDESKDDKTSNENGTVVKTGRYLESSFDKWILRLFAEVRYWLKFQGVYEIVWYVDKMYQDQNHLRVLRESVMLVVRDYNTIIDALKPDEQKLFKFHLDNVDRELKPGIEKLSWNETQVTDWFVASSRACCQQLYQIVLSFKENNRRILQACRTIEACSLMDIESNTVYETQQFEMKQNAHQALVQQTFQECHSEILDALDSSYQFFAGQPANIQQAWLEYVQKVDMCVERSFFTCVRRSLSEFARAIQGDTKNKSEPHPLFRINLVLDEREGKET
jgi:dynein heavy chain